MFRRSKTVVGLDIGSYGVRAVEATRSGDSLVLSGFGRARIESPDAIEDTILKVLGDAGIRTRKCVTAVSGRSVIVRYVPMMPLPDTELKQAIRYEADKYIPFEVDEVILDCQKIEEPVPGEQMRVVLVAVKRTMIEEHVAMLDRLGLVPAVVDVDVFALGNAFESRNRRLGAAGEEIRGLVDVGSSKTNINIMRGNTSYFTREIYIAGNDLTEAVAKRFGEDPSDVERMKEDPGGALETMQDAIVSVLEDIGSEIRLSFDYYENQFDQEVKEVYLSGGSVLFPGIDRMLSNIFNLETRLWDPMEAFDISSPRFDASRLEGMNSDMGIAVGLATRLRSL
jgi:type IV pilus assembly protein PilM